MSWERTIKQLEVKEKVCFAKKLLKVYKPTTTKIQRKMEEIYQRLKKYPPTNKYRYQISRYLEKILRVMTKTIGRDETENVLSTVLELNKKQARSTSNAVVTTASETTLQSALPRPPSVGTGPQAVLPIAYIPVNVCIEARNSVVNAPVMAGCNGNINTSMNLQPSTSSGHMVSDKNIACSNEDIQKAKDDIKRRIKNTWEFEGMNKTTVDVDKLYTEIHIMGRDFTHAYNKHEIWQVEMSNLLTVETEVIKYHEIFKAGVGGRTSIKSVLMKGIAGIGKTITVKKYLRDWAEERNKDDIDFDFVFLLPFRDLNTFKNGNRSLLELVQFFYPELKTINCASVFESKVLFIFDGLDESQFPLGTSGPTLLDVTTPVSLDVLLTSLMRGKLLHSARLWITTRPAAAAQLPEEMLSQGYISQIQGFNDQQREEYFRKKFQDENEARRIVSYLKSSRSLYIMCHVPLFCWLSAIVLEGYSHSEGECGEIPKSLTEMYIHFLLTQTGFSYKKYKGQVQARLDLLKQHKDIIWKLGKLAFQNLESQKIYFDERDLSKCEIHNVNDALMCPGLCAELLKMENGLYSKYYCFVHLSLQEFLAALYAFHEFAYGNYDTLSCFKRKKESLSNLTNFLNAVVDKAISSKNGHLDLFTRFLFGISLDANKALLAGFLPTQGSSKEYHRKVAQHIKALRKSGLCPDRCVNLIHCLVEIDDKSFLKELENHKNGLVKKPLTPFQCSALAYQLVRSEEGLQELDLKKYKTTEDCYHRLTPAIQFSKRVLLNCLGITKTFCHTLALTLCVPNVLMTELDLSYNCLQSGIRLLSDGLRNPNCKIEKLNLCHNNLNYQDVLAIRDVLKTPHSKLRVLDLSNNDFGHQDVGALCEGLRSSHLRVLGLSGCRISDESCCSLASALQSTQCHLEELDLSYNHPKDLGKRRLLQLKDSASCALNIVKMHEAGEHRDKTWLHKYHVDLKLDPNTVNGFLQILSDGKRVKRQPQQTPYPDHQDRFDKCNQVLCTEGLRGRHYWEVLKYSSEVHVGVAYAAIGRKGAGDGISLGNNSESWSFAWSPEKSRVSHNKTTHPISASPACKLGVFLDWGAGTLTFYGFAESSFEEPVHLHTFHATFKEPVYPAFRIQVPGTDLTLC